MLIFAQEVVLLGSIEFLVADLSGGFSRLNFKRLVGLLLKGFRRLARTLDLPLGEVVSWS